MSRLPSADLLSVAARAAGEQHHPRGALYVVATPIGNLADITLRAIHCLDAADAIACEDTRTTATLLRHLGLDRKPLLAVHEHNEREAAEGIVARLVAGERVALVSDAGTPAVSDPGARVVDAVRQAGLRVVPLPGPSAAVTVLSAAGDAHAQGYRFLGFLPTKGAERAAAIATLRDDAACTVLYESPHRVAALARDLASALGARMLTVGREVTKQFESIERMTAADWPAWLAADENRQRGEFAVVVHAQAPVAADRDGALPEATLDMLRGLLPHLPLKQAVALAVQMTGAPRNAVYQAALGLRAEESGDPPPAHP